MIMKLVLFLVLALTGLSLVRAQCGTTVAGHKFDFSGLTHSSGQDYSANDASGYTYKFNVCGLSTNGDGSCAPKQGTICQYNDGATFVAVVAKWTGTNPGIWSAVDASDPSKGVVLTFDNGDPCYPSNNPRQSHITFICDPKTVGAISVAEQNCNYAITFPTAYACLNAPAPPGSHSGSKKLSGGWVFVIILLTLIPVYIIAGCFWNHRKHPEQSWPSKFPNLAFWKDLPSLMKDGCVFTWRKMRVCFARCSGKTETLL